MTSDAQKEINALSERIVSLEQDRRALELKLERETLIGKCFHSTIDTGTSFFKASYVTDSGMVFGEYFFRPSSTADAPHYQFIFKPNATVSMRLFRATSQKHYNHSFQLFINDLKIAGGLG